ncbi:MAG: hypothetical protein SNJ71_01910 [Bacteroidales bacterium]
MRNIIRIVITIVSVLFAIQGYSQCATMKGLCPKNALKDDFDYRGQSTYGKLKPGDTTRIKLVLYSKNRVHITLCSEPQLGDVQFRILKTIREYKRTIERIDKTEFQEPVYKKKPDGSLVQEKDDAGLLKYDDYGDPVYVIESYNKIVKTDTVWKTIRNVDEKELFNSKSGNKSYEEDISVTQAVILEVIVPSSGNAKEDSAKEACIGVMVGRQFIKTGTFSSNPVNQKKK